MPRISVLGTRRGSGLGFSRNFGSSSVQDAEENWDELIDLHSDLREVMETFQTFDEDKDMRLNRDELLVAMTTIGQPVDDNLITEMIDSVAPGQDSVIRLTIGSFFFFFMNWKRGQKKQSETWPKNGRKALAGVVPEKV
mmetsp:Transcript_2506/g.3884  ORF Transcript_2506/g.3884 Transcript_2506/m.3884 type:complete len:139 (+) Transcript_2506:38-454(+)